MAYLRGFHGYRSNCFSTLFPKAGPRIKGAHLFLLLYAMSTPLDDAERRLQIQLIADVRLVNYIVGQCSSFQHIMVFCFSERVFFHVVVSLTLLVYVHQLSFKRPSFPSGFHSYDYFLMFQEEVELIWRRSSWRSFMRVFYVSSTASFLIQSVFISNFVVLGKATTLKCIETSFDSMRAIH